VREEQRASQAVGDFQSANKKDAHAVTKGKSLMSTTQAGRHIGAARAAHPYEMKKCSVWDVGEKLAEIRISYKMDHILEGMGIKLDKKPKKKL
jgi:hypothetical protein